MIVGILKEIKAKENCVCMTPAGVEVMKANGHCVLVEKDAGNGSGFNGAIYIHAGAEIVDTPKVKDGKVTYQAVAEAFDWEAIAIDRLF